MTSILKELINSVRLIKMYAWEEPFSHKIGGVRRQEEGVLRRAAYLQVWSLLFA